MDLLRQNLAPISNRAWEEINETAQDKFKSLLSARKFSAFEGPKGLDFAAVGTGKINIKDKKSDVKFGLYEVMPLVEARVSFKLNLWELDNLERGAEGVDLSELEEAAEKMAAFEEKIIYKGLKSGGIDGIYGAAENKLNFTGKAEDIPGCIAHSVNKFNTLGIEGPYTLIVNPDLWVEISSQNKGYPLLKQVKNLIEGDIIVSESADKPVLLSKDSGGFKIVSGIDLSIGYHSHNTKEVELYFTESFTFRVIDPDTYIVFE